MRLHTVADASKTVEYCDDEIVFFTDRHGIKFVLVDSHKVHALLEPTRRAFAAPARARASGIYERAPPPPSPLAGEYRGVDVHAQSSCSTLRLRERRRVPHVDRGVSLRPS